MKKRLACPLVLLALLVVLLTPASANSAPTRLGGTGGSALTVDEGCPVTVTAEQLTFLPLREAEERCYTAHFDSLPDGELTFTLYPRLSITLADRLHAVLTSYQFTFAFFLLILPLTLLALPALLIFLLQRRSRRQT